MYAKVFTQIFDSSIAEDYRVRLVFEDLLKLADVDGVVDMTSESIARRTNVPLEIVTEAITKLEAPDTRSRNPTERGARIKRLDSHRDWGWFIVNHAHYRALKTSEDQRENTRKRVQKYRARQLLRKRNALQPLQGGVSSVSSASASACTSVSESGGIGDRGKGVSEAHRPSEAEVVAYASIIGLGEWKARDWFAEMDGCGWLDYQHRAIQNWQSVLVRVKTKWESDGRPSSPPKSKQNENHSRTNKSGVDRNKGTYNEGTAHLYANAAIKAGKVPDVGRPNT